jgi:hypothetical protein
VEALKDGRSWQVGTTRDIDWIVNRTTEGVSITVAIYWSWPYVLVAAGPEQALTWRTGRRRAQYGVLPDLFFPEDRSWLVSALWDDTWTCIGGSKILVEALHHDPLVQAHRVQLGVDAKPPGRERDDDESNDEMSTEPNPRMPLWYRDT